jgi:SNF2 family DNA or RNA helicase
MFGVLKILDGCLNHRGDKYERLGEARKAAGHDIAIERDRRETDSLIVLANARTGDFALTLTVADTVIFYDSD